MRKLEVDLGDRSYPIFIAPGLLADPDKLVPFVHGAQIMIVTNETVAPLYLEQVKSSLKGFSKVDAVVLPDGEEYKTLEVLGQIYTALLENRHNRKTTIIALGGGVIGDMSGYAAASYQRGVDFVQIPTTLLSQVDSSVGGKTGVNHPLGKNMIGAFHQPNAVIIDIDALKTLPARELSAGLAEVIKYGLIADAEFFVWLEENISRLMALDEKALAYAIEVSCATKAKVVAQDEKESGIRAILNLGHTFGHAIEAHQGYGRWLHGEAVGVGMVMACDLSARQGWIPYELYYRARKLIQAANLPVEAPKDMTPEVFMEYMAVDKKVLNGGLRLVLLKGLGDAVVTEGFEQELLLETLKGEPLK